MILETRAMLDIAQRDTLDYFVRGAHPACLMALDRSVPGAYGPEAIAVGGSGFGLMALLVGAERGWIRQADLIGRLATILSFLETADRFHGVYPHFLNGRTGQAIPFGPDDDGGDIVETAFLMAGLLAVRSYLGRARGARAALAGRIDRLWHGVEWDWHTQGRKDVLYWHWSPNTGFARNFPVTGWDECLVTYVLGAGSPTHPLPVSVYEECWVGSPTFLNGRTFHGIRLPLGPDWGGPLCFAHYSFLGIDPRGLHDDHADYWEQAVAHTLVNRAHCLRNPGGFEGYGPACWGLTASDDDGGYHQHAPDNDNGTIAPTAALSSFPYAPDFACEALETFLGRLRDDLWTPLGPRDAFCESRHWFAPSSLAIDQGPIVVMIENHRSGLVWDLLMDCREVRDGLSRLGFRSPRLAGGVS